MNNFEFKKSYLQDLTAVKALLKQADLPFEDIDDHYEHFIVATENNKLAGVIGLERYSSTGLLRSLAVEPSHRKSGLGTKLVKELTAYSHSLFIKELYLLTITADTFFEKFGFTRIDRNMVPVEIKCTKEFGSICPVSAICMKKEI